MRRLILAAAFAALSPAAFAAGWESGMVEDEGGPAMMAWVYAGSGEVPPELRMMCGDGVNLRYGQGSDGDEAAEPMTEPLIFTFDFGETSIPLSMQYEEMDGMFAAYFPLDAPILALLRSAASVSVDDPTGAWHEQAFTLEGSNKAIGALLATCG
jgi:hypothetical protein